MPIRAETEKAKTAKRAIDKRAQEIGKDTKREKTEFDRHTQETHWDIYSRGKEVEEDIKREESCWRI